MKRGRWRLVFWMGWGLILAMGLYGCADLIAYRTLGERETESRTASQGPYRFEDIPVPLGMDLNRRESFIYETKASKTGLLVYEGRGETGKLVRFFKQEMSKFQWKLVSSFELNNVMLIFMKEGWCSVIYIVPYSQDEEMKRLEIRVGPVDVKLPK